MNIVSSIDTHLSVDVVTPLGGAAGDLTVCAASLGTMLSMRLLPRIVPVLMLHLVIAFVDAAVHLLPQATTMTEEASLATFVTTKTAFAFLAALESSLFRRGRVCAALLGAAACVG